MRLKTIITGICVLCLAQVGFSQKPTWVEDAQRKKMFAEKVYFTSFLVDNEINKKVVTTQVKLLKAFAIEQIQSTLRIQLDQQANNQTTPYYLIEKNIWLTQIESLIQHQHYYDAKTRQLYVMAYLKKSDLQKKYKELSTQYREGVTNALEKSRAKLQQKYYRDALKACMNGFAYLRKLEFIHLAIATVTNNASSAVKSTPTELLKVKELLKQQLIKIQAYNANNLTKVAEHLVQSLAIKVGSLNKPIQLLNFTYRNSGINSQFSRRFHQVLKSALQAKNIELAEVSNAILYDAFQRNAYQLKGCYWEQKESNQIRLVILLEEGSTGKLITSLDLYLNQSVLQKQKTRFKPIQYQKALAQIKVFNQNQSPTRGGLELDVWTNKGKQNPIFVKGEEVKFYVKASKPCYLRFIYHLADGTTVLLLDNYYIGVNKINKVYEIPQVFECAAPFGLEILHLNAQARQFRGISIQKTEGYKVITGNIAEFLKSSRANSSKNARAETKVLITTLDN